MGTGKELEPQPTVAMAADREEVDPMSEPAYCIEGDGQVADHERPSTGGNVELVCQDHADPGSSGE